jgi:hypothetical protein
MHLPLLLLLLLAASAIHPSLSSDSSTPAASCPSPSTPSLTDLQHDITTLRAQLATAPTRNDFTELQSSVASLTSTLQQLQLSVAALIGTLQHDVHQVQVSTAQHSCVLFAA